jgi:CheY-like chemotaxis protein
LSPPVEVLQQPATRPVRGGLKIVVVDDNADAADSLRLVLEDMRHQVRVARNGLEAVDIARAFAPNLIFMDVGMPEMDGLEATRRIRSESHGEAPVIVALTGWGQAHDRDRTRDAGADCHVVKPISAEELVQIIESIETSGIDSRGPSG